MTTRAEPLEHLLNMVREIRQCGATFEENLERLCQGIRHDEHTEELKESAYSLVDDALRWRDVLDAAWKVLDDFSLGKGSEPDEDSSALCSAAR